MAGEELRELVVRRDCKVQFGAWKTFLSTTLKVGEFILHLSEVEFRLGSKADMTWVGVTNSL